MILVWCERTKRKLPFEEKVMADFTKLMQDIADLSAKVDAALAKPAPTPPPEEQPQVDQAAAAVEAISAKIPAVS